MNLMKNRNMSIRPEYQQRLMSDQINLGLFQFLVMLNQLLMSMDSKLIRYNMLMWLKEMMEKG